MEKAQLYQDAKYLADSYIREINQQLLNLSISQATLAAYARIDTGNLSKILSGVLYPNLKTYCRIRVALDDLIVIFNERYEN